MLIAFTVRRGTTKREKVFIKMSINLILSATEQLWIFLHFSSLTLLKSHLFLSILGAKIQKRLL
jgi:hypothetical protein